MSATHLRVLFSAAVLSFFMGGVFSSFSADEGAVNTALKPCGVVSDRQTAKGQQACLDKVPALQEACLDCLRVAIEVGIEETTVETGVDDGGVGARSKRAKLLPNPAGRFVSNVKSKQMQSKYALRSMPIVLDLGQ
jgi:hypothetical protein